MVDFRPSFFNLKFIEMIEGLLVNSFLPQMLPEGSGCP